MLNASMFLADFQQAASPSLVYKKQNKKNKFIFTDFTQGSVFEFEATALTIWDDEVAVPSGHNMQENIGGMSSQQEVEHFEIDTKNAIKIFFMRSFLMIAFPRE